MKKIKLLLMCALPCAAFMLAGCDNKTKYIDVPVYDQDIQSVTFISEIKDGISIYQGESLSLAAKVTIVPSTSDYTIIYDSSDKTVATVSENGLLSAKAAGSTKITATVEGVSSNFNVTVLPVTAVIIDAELADGIETAIGGTIDLAGRYSIDPDGATYPPAVQFTSSDEDVATVDENGLITAVGGGETTITVTIHGKSASFDLLVIAVDSIEWDAGLKANGMVLEGIGKTEDVTDKMTVLPAIAVDRPKDFSSSDESVATISPAGLITTVGVGTTTITAAADGVSDSFELTVVRGILTSVALDYPVATKLVVPVGATNRIWGHVNIVPVPADLKNKWVNFSSSDTDVAKVDQYGVIIGVAPGTATVTVAADGDLTPAATLEVEVAATTYYARNTTEGAVTPWSMTTSPAPNTGNGSDLTAALDGVYGSENVGTETTVLILSRGSIATSPIEIVVDTKEQQVVNVFKIIHRSGPNTNRLVRFFGFDKIEGSNNGTDFTTIATMVEVADAQSPLKLAISETTFENETAYQYYRFTAQTVGLCFIKGMANYPGVSQLLNADRTPSADWNSGSVQNHTDNQGGSAQIQELYLGKTE